MIFSSRSTKGAFSVPLLGLVSCLMLLPGCSSSPAGETAAKSVSGSSDSKPQNEKQALDSSRIEEEKKRFLASQAGKQ